MTRNGVSSKVTQIAFPEATNAAVYGTSVYAARGGDPATSLSATFQVGISA